MKTTSKKVVHQAGEFLRNKTADAGTKSKDDKIVRLDEIPGNAEKIIIPPEKRDEILK